MSNNGNACMKQIEELSNIKNFDNVNQLIFNLGMIHGICKSFNVPAPEIPVEPITVTKARREKPVVSVDVESMQPSTEVIEKIEKKPAELDLPKASDITSQCLRDSKPITRTTSKPTGGFGEAVVKALVEANLSEQVTDKDGKTPESVDNIKGVLRRRSSYGDLKSEITKRWHTNTSKVIIGALRQKGITTTDDLVKIFDNPDYYAAIKYPMATNKSIIKEVAKVFPYYELDNSDKEKFANMYIALNEFDNKTAYDIMREFLVETEHSTIYTTRYTSSLVRNGIVTINQLYFWLTEQITSLKGVGHVNFNIIKMKEYIKKHSTQNGCAFAC